MPALNFTSEARADLDEIWQFLADEAGECIADRVVDDIRTIVNGLRFSPCPETVEVISTQIYEALS